MADLLPPDAIDAELERLDGWQRRDRADGGPDAICRERRFTDFAEAMTFVNLVAGVAERLDHHPDIAISYDTVELTVWSHSAGGVTPRCIELASAIDAL